MVKYIQKSSVKKGLPPGTLVHVGEEKLGETRISLFEYDTAGYREAAHATLEDVIASRDSQRVSWINISGLSQVEVIQQIGSRFDLHPLVMEDLVSTGQRPKVEDHEVYLFIVLKMLYLDDEDTGIQYEQVSLILGKTFVLSFQEAQQDVFEPLRDRIRTGKGRIRKMGADHLAYALLDAIVDHYYVVLEKLSDDIEALEETLMSNPSRETLQTIHGMKNEMLFLRKSVWPLREVLASLARAESSLIQENTVIYLRDVYDHTIQVVDTIEMFRDMISGMRDTYLSSISNRMNEVMKVLTIFASIFIPLTFIAGIYGMNFAYMPELEWRWSYPLLWGIMITLGVSMVIYFRNRKWF
ncbi:MAG TPA: magnesium/cobalt transporter CorA [Deltaproteobacteria bacterium]|nr:magnesium/cobalt transporter CorA [Deltaproteobacteria bacterium]